MRAVVCRRRVRRQRSIRGYTKSEARQAAYAGLAEFLEISGTQEGLARALLRSRKFTIVKMRHRRSSTGSNGWLVKFRGYDTSREFQDQYCILVWIDKETGPTGGSEGGSGCAAWN